MKEKFVHSDQHYDSNMSDVFFKVLNIKKPYYFLNVGSRLNEEKTGKINNKRIKKIILKEKPNNILIYGYPYTILTGAIIG